MLKPRILFVLALARGCFYTPLDCEAATPKLHFGAKAGSSDKCLSVSPCVASSYPPAGPDGGSLAALAVQYCAWQLKLQTLHRTSRCRCSQLARLCLAEERPPPEIAFNDLSRPPATSTPRKPSIKLPTSTCLFDPNPPTCWQTCPGCLQGTVPDSNHVLTRTAQTP